jgi:hypothetical protein
MIIIAQVIQANSCFVLTALPSSILEPSLLMDAEPERLDRLQRWPPARTELHPCTPMHTQARSANCVQHGVIH